MTSGHIIFIPRMIMIGMFLGFILGTRAAKNQQDLQAKLKEAKEELFKLRFQLAIRQLDNTAEIGSVRNRIAMIQTVLRETKAVGGTN